MYALENLPAIDGGINNRLEFWETLYALIPGIPGAANKIYRFPCYIAYLWNGTKPTHTQIVNNKYELRKWKRNALSSQAMRIYKILPKKTKLTQ